MINPDFNRRFGVKLDGNKSEKSSSGIPHRLHSNLSELDLLNLLMKCRLINKLWKSTSIHDK